MREADYCKVLQTAISKSKILEAHAITGLEPGRLRVAPVKEGRSPKADTMLWGSPGSHCERHFPFLECVWEVALPLRGQKSQQAALPALF